MITLLQMKRKMKNKNATKKHIFLISEIVVCAQMRACMPDRLPEGANAILV